ncbi:MAG: putative Dolichyl-diphosphooligosaccharide--protein glycosyltransferase subunit STT3 [Streblomastix strix]|uniref:dolichyl-diphosphooligosaccharide--protein glycotransferase n=1 Tax=Streblomastix strix TaxID=222440 RepID=A0A5J4W627_9EUKA|nr:MAG: putative Dolichyl-diphosphooligosaccharide--protein glycosyltransferase subunit STT3 [Streblomastix strix]
MIIFISCALAIIPRLFNVVRYESIIHEFDPYFNYRSSQYLVNEGMYKFHNWFDERAWYPLGRIVGTTVYPGLMWSAVLLYKILEVLGLPVDIKDACVLVSPIWAVFTVLVTYYVARMVWNKKAALVSAFLISVIPGYMSRSVAGAFDNECISIFALLAVFALWIRSMQSGSMLYCALCSLAYFYMASAWGGYVFIINLIPLYVLAMLVMGRYSVRLHVAYTTFYILGILLSMQIQFVSFMPVQSGEHLAAFAVFIIIQIYGLVLYCDQNIVLPGDDILLDALPPWPTIRNTILGMRRKTMLLKIALPIGITIFIIIVVILFLCPQYITPWTGRFYNLLHPSHAKRHIPIIASVSEHQPSSWSTLFEDLHITALFFIPGVFAVFQRISMERQQVDASQAKKLLKDADKWRKDNDILKIKKKGDKKERKKEKKEQIAAEEAIEEASEQAEQSMDVDEITLQYLAWKNDGALFICIYGIASLYFASEMVRLVLVVAPAACILSGIGISELGQRCVDAFIEILQNSVQNSDQQKEKSNEVKQANSASKNQESVSNSGNLAQSAVERRIKAQNKKKSGIGKKIRSFFKSQMKSMTSTSQQQQPQSHHNPLRKSEIESFSKNDPSEDDESQLPRFLRCCGSDTFLSPSLPLVVIVFVGIALGVFGFHALYQADKYFSSPSIVIQYQDNEGRMKVMDDFREAYGWLRHNTDVNAKVMSWWDYGYQLSAVANRTVIVDNNTWNSTHIATVGMIFASSEEQALPVLQMLGVDYILILFGGNSGYQGDDINKFHWMLRIAGGSTEIADEIGLYKLERKQREQQREKEMKDELNRRLMEDDYINKKDNIRRKQYERHRAKADAEEERLVKMSGAPYPQIKEDNYLSHSTQEVGPMFVEIDSKSFIVGESSIGSYDIDSTDNTTAPRRHGGTLRVDEDASPVFLDSIIYKMSFYGIDNITSTFIERANRRKSQKQTKANNEDTYQYYTEGVDVVRRQTVGGKDIRFAGLEEAFISETGLVRIFRVKKNIAPI